MASAKPQRLQKWMLLTVSIVAIAVWSRNLLILLPNESTNFELPAEASSPVNSEASPRRTFDDSKEWKDPFAPPQRQVARREADSAQPEHNPKPAPEPPPWKLAGVVWDRKSPAAILSSIDGQFRIVVVKGDTLGAARIERIEERSVWLKHSGMSWKLALDEPGETISQ